MDNWLLYLIIIVVALFILPKMRGGISGRGPLNPPSGGNDPVNPPRDGGNDRPKQTIGANKPSKDDTKGDFVDRVDGGNKPKSEM